MCKHTHQRCQAAGFRCNTVSWPAECSKRCARCVYWKELAFGNVCAPHSGVCTCLHLWICVYVSVYLHSVCVCVCVCTWGGMSGTNHHRAHVVRGGEREGKERKIVGRKEGREGRERMEGKMESKGRTKGKERKGKEIKRSKERKPKERIYGINRQRKWRDWRRKDITRKERNYYR